MLYVQIFQNAYSKIVNIAMPGTNHYDSIGNSFVKYREGVDFSSSRVDSHVHLIDTNALRNTIKAKKIIKNTIWFCAAVAVACLATKILG